MHLRLKCHSDTMVWTSAEARSPSILGCMGTNDSQQWMFSQRKGLVFAAWGLTGRGLGRQTQAECLSKIQRVIRRSSGVGKRNYWVSYICKTNDSQISFWEIIIIICRNSSLAARFHHGTCFVDIVQFVVPYTVDLQPGLQRYTI